MTQRHNREERKPRLHSHDSLKT